MALLSGMGQEDAAGPHPLPIGCVRPEDAPEVARVAHLLAQPEALSLPPLWTALVPTDDSTSAEGQAILSLDIGGRVRGRMGHLSWFLLVINQPELLPGFIDFVHARHMTVYAHEPVPGEDPARNPSLLLTLMIPESDRSRAPALPAWDSRLLPDSLLTRPAVDPLTTDLATLRWHTRADERAVGRRCHVDNPPLFPPILGYDKAKTVVFKPQVPAMEAVISRHSI